MKKMMRALKIVKSLNKIGVLLFVALFIQACTSSVELDFKRGQKAFDKQEYDQALSYFDKVISRSKESEYGIQAAKLAANIAFFNIKEFKKALKYYKYIVINSQVQSEQIEAQQKIAEIVFNHLSDYKQSITEYTRLLNLPHSEEEGRKYKFTVAKAYFFTSNFYQAKVEVESLINKKIEDPRNFDPLLLKANILLTTKKVDEAIEIFEKVIKHFPEKSIKDRVVLSLAVCHEEKKQFAEAIDILNKEMNSSFEEIEQEIRRDINSRSLNDPKNYNSLSLLLNLYLLIGNKKEAENIRTTIRQFFVNEFNKSGVGPLIDIAMKSSPPQPIRFADDSLHAATFDYIYYLAERVYQLHQRKALMPGARGLRK